MPRNMNTDLQELRQAKGPTPLASVMFPDAMKVLVLAPHPDDFDEIAVTLRFFHDRGHAIKLAVSRTGSGVLDNYCSPPTLAVKEQIREKEQRASCRLFGLAETMLTFLDLERDEADQPVENSNNVARLIEVILPFAPDIVCLPHSNDTNSGHRRMYALFRTVAGQTRLPMVAFLNRDPKTIRMRMDLYTPFGEAEAGWKASLLRCHDTQQQRNLQTRGHGLDDRILNTNRQIARELGIAAQYAEAFEVEWPGVGSA